MLWHVAEPGSDLLVLGRALAKYLSAAGRWFCQSEEQLDRGALAGAVRAEKAGDRAADLEADPVKRYDRAVPLRQVVGA